jgi:hypothetical protein
LPIGFIGLSRAIDETEAANAKPIVRLPFFNRRLEVWGRTVVTNTPVWLSKSKNDLQWLGAAPFCGVGALALLHGYDTPYALGQTTG